MRLRGKVLSLVMTVTMLVACIPYGAGASPLPQEVALNPTEDVLIAEGVTPIPAETLLKPKTNASGSIVRIAYMQFDKSSFTEEVGTATLEFKATFGTTPPTTAAYSVYGILDDSWTQSTLIWSNAPVTMNSSKVLAGTGYTYIGDVILQMAENNAAAVYTVDVTDFVKSQTDAQVSFVILDKAGSNANINIRSREHATESDRPKLTIKTPVTSTPVITDQESVNLDKADLTFNRIKGSNTEEGSISSDLNLITTGTNGSTITWSSSDTAVISVAGAVYRPAAQQGDKAVTLTATLTKGSYTDSKMINLTVKAQASSPGDGSTPVPYSILSVTASADDGNIPENTMDGDLATRWSALGDGQWIKYDLGSIQSVGYMGVAFNNGTTRVCTFDMEVSNDDITWTRVLTGSKSSGTTIQMEAYDFADVSARYVKIIGYGNTVNKWNSITEVHIYPPNAAGPILSPLVRNTPVEVPENITYTKPGLYNPDGTPYSIHLPNPVTGRTLNVLDYGANPLDNAMDDRAAIQSAIDAAIAGDEVYLPNGIYNLNSGSSGDLSAHLVLKTGVNLRGESEAGTILKSNFSTQDNTTTNTRVLKMMAVNNMAVTNLTVTAVFDPNNYSANHQVNNPLKDGPVYAIHVEDISGTPSYNITLDHITVENFQKMAVRVSKSHNVIVRNSTFRNATDTGGGGAGYGVSFQGGGNGQNRLGYKNDTRYNLVEDCSFIGPYIRHGVLLQYYAHNNAVRNNRFEGTVLDSIDLHGEDEYLNEIYGNYIKDITTGAGIAAGNTGATHDASGPLNYIHENIIENSREGVKVHMASPDTIIERNIIRNTTNSAIVSGRGIYLQNAPRTIVRDNQIYSNTAPNYWGILLAYDEGDRGLGVGVPTDIQIVSNAVYGNANGVKIEVGTNISLVSNDIRDNLGVNLIDNSTSQSEVVTPRIEAGNGQLVINWVDPGSSTFTGVNIYQGESLIASLPKNQQSYTVTGLTNGVEYTFTIKTLDSSSQESAGVIVKGTPIERKLELYPTQDAYVDITDPDGLNSSNNYGGNSIIRVKRSTSNSRIGYLKFNKAEFTGYVGTAELKLWAKFGTVSSTNPDNAIYNIYGLTTDNWTESTITWNTSPNHKMDTSLVDGEDATLLGNIHFVMGNPNVETAFTLDVTEFIRNHPDHDITFMLIDELGQDANINIYSKEKTPTTFKPVLTLVEGTPVPVVTDAEKVQLDMAELTFDSIKGSNTDMANITANLSLPASGTKGSEIAWNSRNTGVISVTGAVYRPGASEGDKSVALTATVTNGTASDTKTFTLTVKALPVVDNGCDPGSSNPVISVPVTKGSETLIPEEMHKLESKVNDLIGSISSAAGDAATVIAEAKVTVIKMVAEGQKAETIQQAIEAARAVIKTAGAVMQAAQLEGIDDNADMIKSVTIMVNNALDKSGKIDAEKIKVQSSQTQTKAEIESSVIEQQVQQVIHTTGELSKVLKENKFAEASEKLESQIIIDVSEKEIKDIVVVSLEKKALDELYRNNIHTFVNTGKVQLDLKPFVLDLQGIADSTTININVSRKTDAVGGTKPEYITSIGAGVYDIMIAFGDKEISSKLNERLSIGFTMKGIDLSKVEVEKVAPQYLNVASGRWEIVPGAKYDGKTNTVRFKAEYLGNYTLMLVNKRFEDVTGRWSQREIETAYAKGIVSGMSDTSFAPEANITRAQFTTMLIRLLGIRHNEFSPAFSDVDESAWYSKAIYAAYKSGIVSGMGDGKFDPEANITREQMAVMMAKAIAVAKGTKGVSSEMISKTLDVYTDRNDISSWAQETMAAAIKEGLINGISDVTLLPKAFATREQAAVIIKRLFDKL